MTARQIIGYIAEQAGGFACIDRDGKLHIKTIGEDTSEIDIELFNDYMWGEKFICNEVNFDNEEQNYSISDTIKNGVYLDRVLDTELYSNTEGTNIEIDPNNLYIKNEQQVRNIYNQVKNLVIYGFEGQSKIDPAIDIGDIIYIEDKPVVYQGNMQYTGKFKGSISSKIETTQKKNTTVGSTLSYSTKMRILKGQVEQTQEQVNEVEQNVENKVDKNNIIQTINESETVANTKARTIIQENNKTINPDKINLNGYCSSENDNFYVDENGKVYCKDITIKSGEIELEDDGTEHNPNLTIRHQDNETENISSFSSYCTNYFNRAYGNNYRETNSGKIEANCINLSHQKDIYDKTSDSYVADILTQLFCQATNEEINIELETNFNKTDRGIKIRSNINTGSEIIVGKDPENEGEELSFNFPGTKITPYMTVTPLLEQYSMKEIKKNIENFENAIDIVRNAKIYKYNLKSEEDTDKKHIGFIIGEKYKTPNEVITKSKKCIDTYSMSSIEWKCLQELIERDNKKDDEIQILKSTVKHLKDKVQELSERRT